MLQQWAVDSGALSSEVDLRRFLTPYFAQDAPQENVVLWLLDVQVAPGCVALILFFAVLIVRD